MNAEAYTQTSFLVYGWIDRTFSRLSKRKMQIIIRDINFYFHIKI